MKNKNRMRDLLAELEKLTEQAKRASLMTIKPLLEQISDKQGELNRLIVESL